MGASGYLSRRRDQVLYNTNFVNNSILNYVVHTVKVGITSCCIDQMTNVNRIYENQFESLLTDCACILPLEYKRDL